MKLKSIVGVVLDKIHLGDGLTANLTSAGLDDVYVRALGDGSDVDNNDNTQGVSNETDSELSSLSHVDAPNDVIYMVCGVVIAMLLVGLIIILVAVTINKLRKREESASASPASVEAQQTNFGPNSSFSSTGSSQCSSPSPIFATAASLVDGPNGGVGFVHHHHHNNNNNSSSHCNSNSNSNSSSLGDQQQVTFTRTSGVGVGGGNGVTSNGWVFPPKAPTPNIYNCSNNFDALIAANDKNGFKGFRKQFSGRFKRLVAKKPQEPAPAIPPELKPQLKTIYVY